MNAPPHDTDRRNRSGADQGATEKQALGNDSSKSTATQTPRQPPGEGPPGSDVREHLRDYFAAHALAMLSPWHEEPRRAATIAYQIADYMLEERRKPLI